MTAVTAEDLLDRFEREVQEYNNISPDRKRRQRKTLAEFTEFSGKPLEECCGPELRTFMASLIERGMKPTTVAWHGHMIRPFYTWAFEAGLVSGDCLMSIRSVKNPSGAGRQLPRPYSATELRKYRAALDQNYPLVPEYKLKPFFAGRHRYRNIATHPQHLQIEAIVTLALYGGLRLAETYAVTIDDMHPDNDYVVVRHGKGDKPREVPHTKRSRLAIGAWLDFRERMEPGHDFPWLSLSPHQVKDGWLRPMPWRKFEVLMRDLGDFSYHRFRHTCATNWLRAGMPLEKVSKLLGHASIDKTLGYAELVRTDVQQAVEQFEDRFEEQVNGG